MNDFGHKLSGKQQAIIYVSLVWGFTIVLVALAICSNWSNAADACLR